ncbi:MAG: hypothetical protein ABI583_06310, partial [Betaproteobacteria bacterium]
MSKLLDNIGMNSSSTARRFALTLVVLMTAFVAGCAPLQILNTFVPESGLEISRDVVYGTLTRNKLDVYRSKNVSGLQAKAVKPVVVFFYGGAWESGEKNGYLFAAEALTSR